MDLKSRNARRLLADHPSTKAEPGVVPVVGGRALRFTASGAAPVIHSDGIALSRDGKQLYWQALTGRRLWRIATELLRDPALGPNALGTAVEDLGESLLTDGLEIDAQGQVYLTAIERNAIVVRCTNGTMRTLVRDPRLSWPDSLAFGPDGKLYVTTAQIHATKWFTANGQMPSEPYRLFRIEE